VIGPLLRISWLALVRDRWALVLSFVVPIAFFSILALVFGGIGDRRLPTVRLAVLDEDRTEASALLVSALERESALVVDRRTVQPGESARDAARRLGRARRRTGRRRRAGGLRPSGSRCSR
jgi:ABC-2 type transport system permease protein